ncbi:hypothetical protein SBA2_980003 [Acidobacteriia bacterium SbA2]|nr:hypothetical protein SBA2_980003 [Acidobacteriia bacterium SbA2]
MDSSTEINLKDENEQEVPGYIPTKEELIELVKFWYMEILEIDWLWFARGYSCNAWKYRQRFASGRLNRAEKAIGEGAVKQAIKEVRDKFKADDVRPIESSRWGDRVNFHLLPRRGSSISQSIMG